MKNAVLVLSVACLLVACTAQPTEPDARQTEQFHVLSLSELHLNMQAMADRVTSVAFIAMDDNLTPEQKQDRILPLLDGIESIATDIDHNGATTNFSVVNRYMGSFLYDVSVAKSFASRQPPNLVPAQRLINSCLSCHESI